MAALPTGLDHYYCCRRRRRDETRMTKRGTSVSYNCRSFETKHIKVQSSRHLAARQKPQKASVLCPPISFLYEATLKRATWEERSGSRLPLVQSAWGPWRVRVCFARKRGCVISTMKQRLHGSIDRSTRSFFVEFRLLCSIFSFFLFSCSPLAPEESPSPASHCRLITKCTLTHGCGRGPLAAWDPVGLLTGRNVGESTRRR